MVQKGGRRKTTRERESNIESLIRECSALFVSLPFVHTVPEFDKGMCRMGHHGRPINPQTKVDYDFSRGHRSRLLLHPVHTYELLHRFFRATCTVDEFEYRTGCCELLRRVPPVYYDIHFCFFFLFHLFLF